MKGGLAWSRGHLVRVLALLCDFGGLFGPMHFWRDRQANRLLLKSKMALLSSTWPTGMGAVLSPITF